MIPLFKSQFSIGKSILTLDKYSKEPKNGPDSIIQICKENNIDDVFLVEDSMAGFLEAYLNCKDAGLNLRFGVRFLMGEEGSYHKNIVFATNTRGYKQLIKVYTDCHTKYDGKMSYDNLSNLWTDDLLFVVPFYDSFIASNNLTFNKCIPTFFTRPVFLLEDNDLPTDHIIRNHVKNFAGLNNYKTQEAKTIYYKNRSDFKAWMTFKCMNRKTYGSGNTLNKPNLDHCGSREFCFESYYEKANKTK